MENRHSPADPTPMNDSLTRAFIQALASNPHLLDFSLQRSLPVSDDTTPGEVQGALPATTSASSEPSIPLNVSPTALDLLLGSASLAATVDGERSCRPAHVAYHTSWSSRTCTPD